MTSDMIETGSIYFLQVGFDGPIKIGYTKRDGVLGRIRQLQASSPYCLRWIGVFEGTRKDERAAQSLLRNSHLRSEWFHPTMEVLNFVREKSPDFLPITMENNLLHSGHNIRGRKRWAENYFDTLAQARGKLS